MGVANTRGLTAKEELQTKYLIRDTRPVCQRFFSMLNTQRACASGIFVCGLLSFFYPGFSYLALVIGLSWFCLYCFSFRKGKLPLRIPATALRPDYNDP
ncbi:MAG: hypothetical protein GY729_01745, partial [Desulfobacteraceae bacterium]|nr:hypothetical protein [Desulfobacteraceae bacterium]